MAKVWLQHGSSQGLFIKTLEPEASWCRRGADPLQFADELSAMGAWSAARDRALALALAAGKKEPKWTQAAPKPFVELSAEDMSGSFDIWMVRDQGLWVCGSERLLFLDPRLVKAAHFCSKERARLFWKSPTACFIKLAAAISSIEPGSTGFDPISAQLWSIVEARDIEGALRQATDERLSASKASGGADKAGSRSKSL